MSTRACPDCGSRRLQIRDNKEKILGYQFTDPIYAKLYICKDCATTWSEGDDLDKKAEQDE